MNTWLEIVAPGLGVSVQDAGRPGHRAIGVPVSGALDPFFLAAANRLAGNPPATAGLEVLLAGPVLRATGRPIRIALAGDMGARLEPANAPPCPVPPWSSLTLHPGDLLRVGAPRGTGYLAVAGGLVGEASLGSLSSYPRAGLGWPLLQAGSLLPCHAAKTPDTPALQAPPLAHEDGPLRVMPGPQQAHFTAAALGTLQAAPYQVGRSSDRMGLRLDGAPLAHSALGADIVSDGVTPGALQVPADGQPILLLADCQTVGGYPKIATVIRADLPRLAHLRPGDNLRFVTADAGQAALARACLHRRLADWADRIRPRRALPDSATLLAANLAGNAVRGDEDPTLDTPESPQP